MIWYYRISDKHQNKYYCNILQDTILFGIIICIYFLCHETPLILIPPYASLSLWIFQAMTVIMTESEVMSVWLVFRSVLLKTWKFYSVSEEFSLTHPYSTLLYSATKCPILPCSAILMLKIIPVWYDVVECKFVCWRIFDSSSSKPLPLFALTTATHPHCSLHTLLLFSSCFLSYYTICPFNTFFPSHPASLSPPPLLSLLFLFISLSPFFSLTIPLL